MNSKAKDAVLDVVSYPGNFFASLSSVISFPISNNKVETIVLWTRLVKNATENRLTEHC